MKKNRWLILGTMLSGTLLAQTVTNAPPAAPLEAPAIAPVATNASASSNAPAKPAKKGKKKSSAKKKPTYELRTVPLEPGSAVVAASNVNVRGQAKLKSEVVARLTKGDQVIVIQEIVRNNSGPDEPSAWAKIMLPTSAHVWANSAFIDTNQTVKVRKLNLRSGPGENYSVLGQLVRGDAVKQLGAKENWVEVEAPTNAYAFMASQYLKQETPAAPPTAPTEVASTVAPVNEPPTVATPPTEPPTVPETAASSTNMPASTNTTTMPPSNTPPVLTEEPPKPRIVDREGYVRGMTSIQAPSAFELISQENHRTIDYLYTTSSDLDLRRYKGLHIIVTGEEALDERWPNTPVLTIQKIQVVE